MHCTKATTVSDLINAPLKNNYRPWVVHSWILVQVAHCINWSENAKTMASSSLASHTLQSQEKEGLVTMRTANRSGGMQ